MFLFSVYILIKNIKNADKNAHDVSSVLLRILTNHLQLISLLQSLRLEWPDFVLEYYDSQDKLGSGTEIALNLDCIINRNSIQPVYANLIGISLEPIIFIVLPVVVWILIKFCVKAMAWTDYRQCMRGTIVNMLFILHPTLLKSSLQMFACTQIDDTPYLDIYMEEECWTGDHWKFLTAVAIPSLIIWGFGLPLCVFAILYRLNLADNLYSPKSKKIYGFLFLGYLPHKYWWQLIILARKTCILAILIWLSSISTVVQALAAQALIWFAIYVQNNNLPYNAPIINRIEIVSLNVSMINLYAGLWYITGDIGQETEIILFVLILLANTIFGIIWLRFYIGNAHWAEKWVKKLDKKLRMEIQYVGSANMIPTIPQNIDKSLPSNRFEFVHTTFVGHQFYTENLTDENMSEVMKNQQNFMWQLVRDVSNTLPNDISPSEPTIMNNLQEKSSPNETIEFTVSESSVLKNEVRNSPIKPRFEIEKNELSSIKKS